MRKGDKPSFAASVRAELIRLPAGRSCCMLSEISALTQTSGHLAFRGGGWFSVQYRLDDAGVARRLFMLLKKRLNVNPVLHFTQSSRMASQKTCVLTLNGEDARTLLFALHMMETDENGETHLKRTVPRHPMTRQCCRRAFLRGAFLGAGTMTGPDRAYHFEWLAEDDTLASALEKLLDKCGLPYHEYLRKGRRIVYLKGAQQIADMLALMGASGSMLEMENIRIQKQMRAAATRASNCDEHNGERMLDAAEQQALAIRAISLKIGLFTLPPTLQSLARARLENQDLSLKQLGEMMDPPLSKNAVNHRMRRLMEIAAELEERKSDG